MGKLRAVLVAAVAAIGVFSSSSASAAEQPQEDTTPARPVKWVGAELNPVATLAGLFGGQLQVGVAGPVSLQGGVSYFGTSSSTRCAGSDGCAHTPGAHGVVFEVGPRVFVPLMKPSGRAATYLWFGPAFGHNRISVDDGSSFQRNRAILDIGVHVPVDKTPLYVIVGAGYSRALDHDGAKTLEAHSPNLASSLFDWARPTQYVGTGSSIRLLFAVGVGF